MNAAKKNLCRTAAFSRSPGFTLVELLAVVGTIAVAAALMFPAAARTRPAVTSAICLDNMRKLALGWQLYSGDFQDRTVNNCDIIGMESTIASKKFENWVNNIMSWSAGSSVDAISITNNAWATNGLLGKYTGGALGVYKCPEDRFLSSEQRYRGYLRRNRSYSMNQLFGLYSPALAGTSTAGLNEFIPGEKQFLKQTEVPKPAKTWLFVEEHPDSINDGLFLNLPSASGWEDLPASYHDGGCAFGFVDGHSEIKKWTSRTSIYPVRFIYFTQPFDAAGKKDFQWYLERTGFVSASGLVLQYGY
jgi:prepilin-type processing-associated H-X9-DG protein